MSKTKIEWCDYTINPVKGLCPMACPYCYARAMYKRFKWNPEIRFEPDTLLQTRKSDSHWNKIFWGSTMELFGDWVKTEWLQSIFDYIRCENYHTHIFLTKQPQNLLKWSPFPDNCWVGVTATNPQMFHEAEVHLSQISASVKFVSIEPMLERFWLREIFYVDWLIIGAQTKPYKPPKIEWVQEIVEAADKAGIPIFLKDNLKLVLRNSEGWTPALYVNAREPDGSKEYLRQEMPIKAMGGE